MDRICDRLAHFVFSLVTKVLLCPSSFSLCAQKIQGTSQQHMEDSRGSRSIRVGRSHAAGIRRKEGENNTNKQINGRTTERGCYNAADQVVVVELERSYILTFLFEVEIFEQGHLVLSKRTKLLKNLSRKGFLLYILGFYYRKMQSPGVPTLSSELLTQDDEGKFMMFSPCPRFQLLLEMRKVSKGSLILAFVFITPSSL